MLNGVFIYTASMPFGHICKSKGNVESMLNESLNQFKFDSKTFSKSFNIFYTFNNVAQPVQMRPTSGSTLKALNVVEANIETF